MFPPSQRRPPWYSGMSLASQVEGSTWVANWSWLPSYHRGLGGKCDESTVLTIINLQPLHKINLQQLHLHVESFISNLLKIGCLSSASKTDHHDMTPVVESGVKPKSIQSQQHELTAHINSGRESISFYVLNARIYSHVKETFIRLKG